MIKPNIHLQNLAAYYVAGLPAAEKHGAHLSAAKVEQVAVIAAVHSYREKLDAHGDDVFSREGLKACLAFMQLHSKDHDIFNQLVSA